MLSRLYLVRVVSQLFGDVVEYVLHILVLFELFEEFVEGLALFVGHLFYVVGDTDEFR